MCTPDVLKKGGLLGATPNIPTTPAVAETKAPTDVGDTDAARRELERRLSKGVFGNGSKPAGKVNREKNLLNQSSFAGI